MKNVSSTPLSDAWSAARQELPNRQYGSTVTYGELQTVKATVVRNGHVSRRGLDALASTIANDAFLSGPAGRDARQFLAEQNQGHALDKAGISAMRADFSIQSGMFGWLHVPGHVVKNGLPASVEAAAKKAQAELDADSGIDGRVEVRKALLAGQVAYIVHTSDFDSEAEDVTLFSVEGKKLAAGSRFDAMSGFSW